MGPVKVGNLSGATTWYVKWKVLVSFMNEPSKSWLDMNDESIGCFCLLNAAVSIVTMDCEEDMETFTGIFAVKYVVVQTFPTALADEGS
jgi:hypothetical protein